MPVNRRIVQSANDEQGNACLEASRLPCKWAHEVAFLVEDLDCIVQHCKSMARPLEARDRDKIVKYPNQLQQHA